MKFARIIERGNRQILMVVSPSEQGYVIMIETHYEGENWISIPCTGYDSFADAYANMMKVSDDEIIGSIARVIDQLSEGQ